MRKQIDRTSMFERQKAATKPDTLARLLDQVSEALPATSTGESDLMIGLLPQHISPAPIFQPTGDRHFC